MYCIKKITDNLLWVGANDRRLAMFEGVYSVPDGVSYNSYLLLDEKTVLFDTVDKAVQARFFENLKEGLGGRKLDYLILQHIEPDHSSAIEALLTKYPDVTLVLNSKSADFVSRFYEIDDNVKRLIVKEGDSLCTGQHTLHFVMAPMVHWPEVMVTYDSKTHTLFSADAFGCFGALNGAIFADEVDINRDYFDEYRRYYTNIVGKYGTQVQALLKKASSLPIDMICPLHGFVWRKNFQDIIRPYELWAAYEAEEQGVMIAYASIYGNTENAAEILSSRLRETGIKTVMFDVSVTPASEIVSAAFKWSHIVFAASTYNSGIFVSMQALISDLVSHNIQNRTVALIENGTWAATSGKLMREMLEKCKNMRFVGDVSIMSSVKPDKLDEINALANAIADTFPDKKPVALGTFDVDALWKIPYGLFLVTAKDGGKDGGCIVNTISQITISPLQISVFISKESQTHDMILATGELCVSVLTKSAPFSVFEHFGLTSGKIKGKFENISHSWSESLARLNNGLYYMTNHTNAVISAKVTSTVDCGSHTIFIARVDHAEILSDEESCDYDFYFKNIKPKPQNREGQVGFVCKICGFVYEGEYLPEDYICPLCKHGAVDFNKL